MANTVSVIIPVYNSEKYLKKSIESTLSQTYPYIEIIAIDDGSQDNSYEVLKSFGDSIRIIKQENKGLSAALSTGIKHIHGNWIKWFSPDDILYPNAIETLVNSAEKYNLNTIVYSNWDIIDENDNFLRTFSELNFNKLNIFDFNVRLLSGQQINVNTTLFPKNLFDQGCEIRTLDDPVAIDYDFFLRAGILFNTKFVLIEKSLIKYRIHKTQLSHANIMKTLNYLPEIKNEILSQLPVNIKTQYLDSLKKYNKSQSISKKTMKMGLKLSKYVLPENITNKILVLYLNKIRQQRL